jgi:para-nitrobenzyl esterase
VSASLTPRSLRRAVESGTLEGVRIGDVLHFRGIPYAEARRFGEPEPPRPWSGTRDASGHGPICPQSPSRLAVVMGEQEPSAQAESCLTLSVSTPGTSERPRPVMVWFHGGAYVIGAGSSEWYRPDALVCEGDVIVVNVNYRIGVFGYLRIPGVASGHLGLMDQIAALGWVQRNIAAFGGDPSQVTVFGESAGGHSVAACMSTEASQGLFRRAIVQSGHIGLGFLTTARADRVARTILGLLDGEDPAKASVERLLLAQQAASAKLAGPAGINSAPIFGPIAGIAPLPHPARADIAEAIVHRGLDLLIGTTREEMRAFFDSNPRLARLRRIPAIGHALVGAVTSAVTRRVFTTPAQRLADKQAAAGASVYTYAFEWAPQRQAFGACHTIDLPFVFGNQTAWRDAPMLGQTPWDRVDLLGREVRRAWTRFARFGDPNADGDPAWARHVPKAAPGRRFR